MKKYKEKGIKMILKPKETKGFTVAEILIVLVIIGVIAALTLSPLSASIQKRQFVTKLKKSYSLLRKVTTSMQQKNTSIESLTVDEFFNEFKSNLNYAKVCNSVSECFGNEYKKAGSNSACSIHFLQNNCSRALKTQDGASYAFCYKSAKGQYGEFLSEFGVSMNGYNGDDKNFTFFYFIVDLNGQKKPNVAGHDYFAFVYLPKYGVVPGGTGSETMAQNYSGYCNNYAADVLKTDKLVDE